MAVKTARAAWPRPRQDSGATGGAARPAIPSFFTAGTRSRRRSPIRRAASASFSSPKTRCGALADENIALPLAPDVVRPDALAARLTPDAVHQRADRRGRSPALARHRRSGSRPASCWCSTRSPIRIMSARSCARPRRSRSTAVVTTARHSPEATGALAKAASGALELVPIAIVQNLARSLAALKERGFLVVGLDCRRA